MITEHGVRRLTAGLLSGVAKSLALGSKLADQVSSMLRVSEEPTPTRTPDPAPERTPEPAPSHTAEPAPGQPAAPGEERGAPTEPAASGEEPIVPPRGSAPGEREVVSGQDIAAAEAAPTVPAPEGPTHQRTYESHVEAVADGTAAEVTAQVPSLSTEELGRLYEHEQAHKKRKTVLTAIEAALAPPQSSAT